MTQVELRLEIDSEAEPLHGQLRVRGEAESHEFDGWIELVHVLETLVAKSGGHPRREGGAPA